jgi:hypothetical protein
LFSSSAHADPHRLGIPVRLKARATQVADGTVLERGLEGRRCFDGGEPKIAGR